MKKVQYKKFFELIFVLMSCILLLTPNSSYAKAVNKIHEIKYNQRQAEDNRIYKTYIKINDSNIPYFDLDMAIKNEENEKVIEIGKLFNDYSNSMNNRGDISNKPLGVPVWGNWCGPGYGSGEPIDLLDEGCRQHDACYVHGGNNCKCNERLISYIDRNYDRMTGGQKNMAKVIQWYFIAENAANGCK